MLQAILDFFKNPLNYPLILGFVAALRAIGELLTAIAKRFQQPGLNRLALWLLKAVEWLGKWLIWVGIGNK